MSTSRYNTRTVLSLTAVTLLLLGACENATSPSQADSANPSKPAGQKESGESTGAAEIPDSTSSFKPAFAVQTSIPNPVYGIGSLIIPTPSTHCVSIAGSRAMGVGDIQVSNIYDPGLGSAGLSQRVLVEVFLYSYSSTAGWHPVSKWTWTSPDQYGVFYKHLMKVPTVTFNSMPRGFYETKVRVSWFLGGGAMTSTTPQAVTWGLMNSKYDYEVHGDALRYPNGYCYLP